MNLTVTITDVLTENRHPFENQPEWSAGNIGVGKTSLTERLGARLGWRTVFESVADNTYLVGKEEVVFPTDSDAT